MPYLLVMLTTVPVCAACASFLRKKFEEVMPLFLCGLIIFSYFCGLLGAISMLSGFLWIGCIFACAYLLFQGIRHGKEFTASIMTPGFFLFLLLTAAVWWMARGRLYNQWDEFSHWGRAVKNMFELDALYTIPESNDGFKDYPPALALLQYLFMKTVGQGFREDIAIFSLGFLTVGMLLYPVSRFSWKNWFWCGLYAGFMFILPASYLGDYYVNTMADGLLGTLFAFVLLAHFTSRASRYRSVVVSAGCMVLALVKTSGMGLAFLAALVVLLDQLICERGLLKQVGRKSVIAGALWTTLPLISVAVVKISWDVHLRAMGAVGHWAENTINLSVIAELFSGTAPQYRYDVLENFALYLLRARTEGGVVHYAPVMILGIGLLLHLWCRYLLPKEERKRADFACGAALACGFVYLFSLLATYLFVLNEQEAVGLASYARYWGTMSTALLLYFTGRLLLALAQKAKKGVQVVGVCVLVGTLLCLCDYRLWLNTLIFAPGNAAGTQLFRMASQATAQQVKKLNVKAPRLHLVTGDDKGKAELELEYELAPMMLPKQKTNVMTAQTEQGGTSYTPESWGQVLDANFDYVYLYEVESGFSEKFGKMFNEPQNIREGTMWRVIRNGGGSIRLDFLY